MLRSLIGTSPLWLTLPLRLALGLIFIGHGAQKVFGVWDGPGWSKFTAGAAPMGLRPGWLWLGAAAAFELLGGILVLLGFATRIGALMIACVMLVAMIGVHWSGGFFLQNKGIEYTVALTGMALALLVAGGGRASVDEALMTVRPRYRRR